MFYVYVLKSEVDQSLYIGYTNDLRRRFKEHNAKHSKYTKSKIPWVLVYYEAYKSDTDARVRESKLKQFKNSYSELKKRFGNSLHEA